MTIPSERYRSIHKARDLLLELLDPKKTPKVPKAIRNRAYQALRHFPSEFEMTRIAEVASDFLENDDGN
jgi:hypothetical protein